MGSELKVLSPQHENSVVYARPNWQIGYEAVDMEKAQKGIKSLRLCSMIALAFAAWFVPPCGPSVAAAQAPLRLAPSPTVPTTQASRQFRPEVPPVGQTAAHAYLMRGLMNIFSLGMDDLAEDIRRAGIGASVYNHAEAGAVVDAIVARYRGGDRGPIILIGHSLGADAVMEMAQALDAQDIPVALVVPFDGTEPHVVPKNVATAINFTQHAYVRPAPDFHGRLENVDLSSDTSIEHTTIDKSERLHTYVLKYVLQAAAPAAKPAPAKPRAGR
jgi:hypothetical protein